MSGIVATGDTLYTAYLQPHATEQQAAESPETHREVVVALDRKTGSVQWTHEYDAGWLDQQETFGGRLRAPRPRPQLSAITW